MSIGARQPDTVRTEFTAPAGTAPQDLAIFLPMKVDRAERGRGQRCEHARVLRDRARDALTAGQSGADHLVGVSAVVLSARRALGSAASLAGDRQDAAGLVDGGVAVEQFAGSPVEVVDAAAQQNRLQAATRVPGGACGGIGGQGVVLLSSVPLRAGWDERRQTCRQAQESVGSMISGAMPHVAWGQVACRSGEWGMWRWHRARASG